LEETYHQVAEGAQEWQSKVDSASSSLEGFNDSIIISSEKQQQLTTEMDSVQTEIIEIAKSATEERRQLTQSEIDRLDELFQKMRDLSQ
jgi:hypothetical protein